MKKYILILLILLSGYMVMGQYYECAHYTVKDGLPSSTVYCMTQDTKGFIWLGTDAGLVRYDGTNFKVFTTKDGLPDNEVLGLSVDKRTDRIWIVTYSRKISYYVSGKFYSEKEDDILLKMRTSEGEFLRVSAFGFKSQFFFLGKVLYKVDSSRLEKIDLREDDNYAVYDLKQWNDSMMDICGHRDSHVLGVYKNNRKVSEFKIPENKDWMVKPFWIDSILVATCRAHLFYLKKELSGAYTLIRTTTTASSGAISNFIHCDGDYVYSKVGDGVYASDSIWVTKPNKIWSGNVTSIYRSSDANIWLATKDDGIYVVKKNAKKNYSAVNGIIHDNITALAFDGKTLFIGNSYGDIYEMTSEKLKLVVQADTISRMKIRGIAPSGHLFFFITDGALYCYNSETGKSVRIDVVNAGPKVIMITSKGNRVMGGTLNTVFSYGDSVSSVVVGKRITAMSEHPDGRIICGSISGLYWFDGGKLSAVDDSNPLINQRISSLTYTADSLLWIATASNGILIYDGKKVVGQLDADQNQSYKGRIARKIIRGHPGEVWVATNAGVNRIKYQYKNVFSITNVTPFDMTDGLLSDDINDLAVVDSLLYVATSKGLTILNLFEMEIPMLIPIHVLSLKINNKDSAIHSFTYTLTNDQNNIQIQFIGVSFLSGGQIKYQYRLLNTSTEWQITTNTSVEFRSLSPGTYIFEVAVLDKFGNRSKDVARVKFTIRPAFYQTIWFWVLIFILALGLGFYLIRLRFSRQQERYQKEQQLNIKIVELEQQALKAQMNPHFIFNCLASIQHFVNKEDGDSANRYLSNFAKLIRKTLDLSGEQYISLDKEVAYLENYVQMEKLRFQDKFEYQVIVDEGIDEYAIMIPPMLIQPIVENAIRHGLRYKENNDGILSISFALNGNSLICKIDDNGIGIKRSREIKSMMHVEYQSKGTKLTESRINAINMINEKKIKMTVTDKYDGNNNATGTLVTITWEQ